MGSGVALGHRGERASPALLAWCQDDGALPPDARRELAGSLLDGDADAVLRGLGHDGVPGEGGETGFRVRDIDFPVGYAAIADPAGFQPLRSRDDVASVRDRLAADEAADIAVVSLAAHRARRTQALDVADETVGPGSATQAGLTVAWPRSADDIQDLV